jgi:hypothetical protein
MMLFQLNFFLLVLLITCHWISATIIVEKNEIDSVTSTTKTTPTSRRVMLEDKKRIRIFDEKIRCTTFYRTNPCGPESKCEDSEDGYICTNDYAAYGCIAGCGLHASCEKDEDYSIYYCKCHDGYEKENEYMPCRLMTF